MHFYGIFAKLAFPRVSWCVVGVTRFFHGMWQRKCLFFFWHVIWSQTPRRFKGRKGSNYTPGVSRLSTERSWFTQCFMWKGGQKLLLQWRQRCSCETWETLWCSSQIFCVLMGILEILKQISSLSNLINDENAYTWFLNTCAMRLGK